MKIYIAHNFAARIALRDAIPVLEAMGHEVTSTWITDDSLIESMNKLDSAMVDLADIARADAIILITDQFGPTPGRGKFFELGWAYAEGKKCYLMGEEDSCVFYALKGMTRIRSWEDLRLGLNRGENP